MVNEKPSGASRHRLAVDMIVRHGPIAGVLMLLALLAVPAAVGQAYEDPDVAAIVAARAVWVMPPSDSASRSDAAVAAGRAQDAAQPEDPWFGHDKALHLGASFLLTLSTQYVLVAKTDLPERRAMPISAGTALSLGLVKEIADSQRARYPLFSWRDMAANAAGVTLAVALILL